MPRPDPCACRRLPRDSAALSRLRQFRDAGSTILRLHLRQNLGDRRSLSQDAGVHPLRPLRPGLSGPVGFRIVTRNPDWLEWLIIQNTNAYEVGFTPVWDGLRNAYWKNKTP